jgi:hypothetical protein
MRKFIYTFFILAFLVSCQSEDKYIYDLNPVEVLPANANKDKEKTIEQFISILYANLFQKALSADEMVEIRRLIESIGDKEVAYEILISNYMNRSDVIIPANEDMRADLDAFLQETYKRFFIRIPSEAEKAYLKNFIESDPNVSAEMVYFSFALSEEYRFY